MAIDTFGRMSITIADQLSTEASTTFYVEYDGAGTTIAQALADWGTLAQKVDACTDGQIIKGSVVIVADPTAVSGPALKAAPVAGSRVEQTGVLNFSNAISTKRFGEAIPALANAAIVNGKIDLTAGHVIDLLITFLKTPTATRAWANASAQLLVALIDALISFRKRRKQLSRSSFER